MTVPRRLRAAAARDAGSVTGEAARGSASRGVGGARAAGAVTAEVVAPARGLPGVELRGRAVARAEPGAAP